MSSFFLSAWQLEPITSVWSPAQSCLAPQALPDTGTTHSPHFQGHAHTSRRLHRLFTLDHLPILTLQWTDNCLSFRVRLNATGSEKASQDPSWILLDLELSLPCFVPTISQAQHSPVPRSFLVTCLSSPQSTDRVGMGSPKPSLLWQCSKYACQIRKGKNE
jgi:hypothetical protein